MMKTRLNYLKAYFPWLLVLFIFDCFTAIFIWLSDSKIFQALWVVLFLKSILFFSILSFVLIEKEKKKAKAYTAFLFCPNKKHEVELRQLCFGIEKERMEQMIETLYNLQKEVERGHAFLSDYEDYVETWAHEIKLPLSLLSLIIDNQKDGLPQDVIFKLDYVRNQIQENISQILFYYRIKSDKKDYLLEEVNVQESVYEVLENFKPLLDEKKVKVKVTGVDEMIYTDARSFDFILSQIISNAVKYSCDHPEINIFLRQDDKKKILVIQDNGVGVKACDVPHIFEKGFTGDSGDKRRKSTGMGLYLAEQLAEDLKIDIHVRSDWMKGFELSLYI